ncbi:dimethylsulfonioproprionate lyase family protein [Rhodobacteraceae bacterium KMM 6894]|nr:dimethylsulfonioproprionate lyase family protein [Rhodobacteraceae bacterium KMM 6894]
MDHDMIRDRATQFIQATAAAYDAQVTDAASRQSTQRIFADLDGPLPVQPQAPERRAACTWLDAITLPEGPLGDVLQTFRALEPALTWIARGGSRANAGPGFEDGHANAMIVGKTGLIPHQNVSLGVSLIAPNIRYPDHNHPPEETYLVLTEGEFFHGDSDWFTPGIGGTFHNTPMIKHAMRAGDTPLFAVWALWA